MIKVTNTILYSAFDNSFNFGCTMKLCNFLEIRIHILLKCNVQGRILCRPWEYSSPNQSDILDYSASNVSNTFLYFTHFWRCESKHFAAEIGSSWFKSNLSLVCQVICQNTSGMVYVLYYSWSNTPSFIITRLPPMHNSNPLASWKLSSMHHYDNTVFLLASSFVMHYSHTPLRRSFKRGGCKMKAFTFRGLLLTGFATHTLTWIHLDLSVFLNVFLEMSKDFVDVVACRSKVHFQVFWKI